MRPLNDREKRLIRVMAIAVGIYLVLFYGRGFLASFEETRAEYELTRVQAQTVNTKILREVKKHKTLAKLRERHPVAFEALAEPTVVGDARVALEKLARACGCSLSIQKELSARSRTNEHCVFQISGGGKAKSVAKLMHNLAHSPYPYSLENVEIKASKKPEMLSYSFTLALLRYDTWVEPKGA